MTLTNIAATEESLDSRVKPRTNLFVSAALISDDGCCPVKVRNISETGALVEGSVLPSPGKTIRLSRGSLTVSGKIAWKKEGRAGLHFDASVQVQDWLPGRRTHHQSAVDEQIHHIRMGTTAPSTMTPGQAKLEPLDAALEASKIASLIEDVASALATDPLVLAHHAWKLQQLDLAIQKLHRIARQ